MKTKLFALVTVAVALSAGAISFAQRRNEPVEKPITGDFKITVRTTISGQPTEGTTMIKGKRERSETNMSVGGMNISSVNVTQCDMRRTIQINDRARKYLITPMDSEDTSGSGGAGTGGGVGTGVTGDTSRRGGVVTMTINTVDTGERKEMFGFTARHLKRSMSMESSPDACSQQQMRIDTDGWYINLEYGLSCGSERPPQMGGRPAPRGCQDRYQYKRTGPTNLGYPLMETTTMYGRDGAAMFSSSKEVIELSRQPLDAALFDIPAGYTQAQSQQEMSSVSMADVMAMSGQQGSHQDNSNNSGQGSMSGMPAQKSAARVKVGVVEFNNKTKSSVSTSALRDQLIALLNGDGVDAVALNASSASEAAMEAKAKGCAYVLFTDISTMKSPSSGQKLGGMLGRAAGIGGGGSGKAEAKFDFRLLPAGGTSPTVQSSASAKEDTEQSTVNTALESEARAVAAALPRN